MKVSDLLTSLLLVTASALPALSESESWELVVPGDSLLSLQVLSVAVDESNVVWIGTAKGVSRLEDGALTHYTTWDGLAGSEIRDITVDKEDVKWFATNGGVSSFDGQDWRSFGRADGLISEEVTSIAIDSENVKWFGTKGGLSRFDGSAWVSFTLRDGLPALEINQVAVGPEGDVWVGTDRGVGRFDGRTWQIHHQQDGLASNSVSSVAIDQNGVVWCGTSKGLSVFDGRVWDSFVDRPGITAVFIDQANLVWIAWQQYSNRDWDDARIARYNHREFIGYPLGDSRKGSKVHSFAQERSGWILFALWGSRWEEDGIYKSTFRVDGSPESVPYRNEEPWFFPESGEPAAFSQRVLLDDVPGRHRFSVTSLYDGGFLLDVGGQRLVRADISGDSLWTKTLEDIYVAGFEEALGSELTVLARSSSSDSLKLYRFGQSGRFLWDRQLQFPPSIFEPLGLEATSRRIIPRGFFSYGDENYLVLVEIKEEWCCSDWEGRSFALSVFDSSGAAVIEIHQPLKPFGLLPGSDGNLVMFGTAYRGEGNYGCATCDVEFEGPFLKMASVDGGEIWHYDSPFSVTRGSHPKAIQTTTGMYMLMDNLGFPGPGKVAYNRILLVMLDSEGEVIWERTLDRSGYDTVGIDLASHPGGGAILLGTFQDGKLWMSHVDAEGSVVKNWNLGETEDGYYPLIGTSPDGDIRVFGYRPDTGVLDVREVAVPSTNVETDRFRETVPSKMALHQNYPNPFNSSTTISFSVAEDGPGSLRVFNLYGGIVSKLTDSFLPAGNYNVPFHAENLASGLYFYKLESGGHTISRKMILLR